MRWLGYPFYRLLFFLTAGIVFQYLWNAQTYLLYTLLAAVTLFTILFFFIKKYSGFSKLAFSLSVFGFFFLLGAINYSLHFQLQEDHFVKKDVIGKDKMLRLRLTDRLAPNAFNDRFYAYVVSVDTDPVSGKVLVLFKKADSIEYHLGDEITAYDDINEASNARNPGDFNYREYLKQIDVYGQVYLDKPRIFEHQSNLDDLNLFHRIRAHILERLKQSSLEPKPRAIIEALVLGQRQNVDPSITKSFRDAGVIHILALSGLHVGIILWILNLLTKRLLRFKHGRWIQSALLVFLLWCFAILTGMSPSIMRAVTMFSAVAIGMNVNRKSSVFHSLTISAFLLLMYDPRLLFQVGFQLSYVAVFSIVLIQPVLAGLWYMENKSMIQKVKNYLWNIFTVTFAAQIGVAPLSIFYFHQFPGLFLVGNMLLLPVLPIIIGGSLLLIVLLLMNVPTDGLAVAINYVLNGIIYVISKISEMDSFIIKNVYLSLGGLVLFYVALYSVVLFLLPYFKRSRRERFYLKKPNWMLHLGIAALLVLVSWSAFDRSGAEQEEFLILHQASGSAVSLSNASEAVLLTDLHTMKSTRATQSLERLRAIEPHRDKMIIEDRLKNLVDSKSIRLVIVDEEGLYDSTIKNATVLLSHSPKINLERLIVELAPKRIISDGSNYRNVAENWAATCKKMNVEFLNTYESGAIKLTD